MIAIIIVYGILYLICTFIMYGELIAEYNSYSNTILETVDKPNFWTYVKVFNPLNVFIGIGFIIWVVYSTHKDKKRDKNKLRNRKHEGIYADINRVTQESVKRTLVDDVKEAHDRFFNDKKNNDK